ncbi:MAG TPA: pilus assembly protein PilO [Chromatiales bacterium]|nr:pilus assembly protein PilO [Thiotrichales bacterium]HIP68778.1 pilus assembly protein PilO [Chromatiales bacterium]
MAFSDIDTNIDFNNLGAAHPAIKAILLLLVLGVLLGLGYYLHTRHQLAELKKAEQQQVELFKTFEKEYKKSANLEAYKAQLVEMERDFGTLLRQLPSKTEIPSLIVDISQTGLASGLEILLFKPQPEVTRDFHAEKPIEIKVQGTYEEMARFASGIASLPRIVTLHDINIKPVEDSKELTMDVIAKTYRYLDDEEG